MPSTPYAAAVDHLYALGLELAPPKEGAVRRKWGLASMRTLAEALGNPQTAFPSILIAGTNGKGSTAATLASILTAAGYRTALYTSPHLVRVNERIQIDGLQIDDEDFARLYFRVDETASRLVAEAKLPQPPSFFEVLTAVAFTYFADKKMDGTEERPVDIAILEVGLGGRLDATNIVDPLLSIITDIALDHQDYLGTTIAEITREKCGILRLNGTLITLPQHPEANQAIGEAAATLHLHAISAAEFIPPIAIRNSVISTGAQRSGETPAFRPCLSSSIHPQESAILSAAEGPALAAAVAPSSHPLIENRYTLTLDNQPLQVDSPLPGHHQQRNLALAIAAAAALRNPSSYTVSGEKNKYSYKIPNSAIEAGIRATHWPGRLELLHNADGPDLLLDVAHNPAGAWTLRAAIAQLPEDRPRTLIFSCLRDKNLDEMSRILFPLFDSSTGADPLRRHDHLIFAPIANPRASTVEDLLAAAHALAVPAHAAPHVAAALAQARQITPPDGLILATGSVYLIGELLHLAGHA